MTTILLINPNSSARTTEMMLAVARPLLPADMLLRGATAATGPAMILDEAALAASAEEVVRIALAEAARADAIIVSAFGNPGAARLRELLPVPVVGIGEAAILEAAADGARFGIATTTPDLVRAIEACIRDLGLQEQFSGIRLSDAHPLSLAADPEAQDEALATAATACIEQDGAQAVVIGGGPLSDTAARLRRRFPTPIVEPVPAAVRMLLREIASSRSA